MLAFAQVWSSVHALDLAHTAVDVVAEYAVAMLFIHRCYPLLAFLFGVGLAWQWQQLAERKVRRLRPRLWALLLIGVCHGLLLWPAMCSPLMPSSDSASLRWRVRRQSACAAGPSPPMRWRRSSTVLPGHDVAVGPTTESAAGGAVLVAQSTCGLALAMHPGEFLERGLAQTRPPISGRMCCSACGQRALVLWWPSSAPCQPPTPGHGQPGMSLAPPPARWGLDPEIIAAGHGGWAARSITTSVSR